MSFSENSLKAYSEIINEGIVGKRQLEVLNFLIDNPNLTDTEIAIGLGYSDLNKTRPRRKELLDLKIIESNGKRTCRITNRECNIWKVVDYPPSITEITKIKKETKDQIIASLRQEIKDLKISLRQEILKNRGIRQ